MIVSETEEEEKREGSWTLKTDHVFVILMWILVSQFHSINLSEVTAASTLKKDKQALIKAGMMERIKMCETAYAVNNSTRQC